MITVDALVAVRQADLRYLAGSAGGGRPVSWAHVCDLPDPWTWVSAGHLVMTTGGGLPEGAGEQAAWLTRLIDAEVGGLVIAPRPGTPRVCDELTAVADEHRFPVLVASFDLEFVSLARTVIESTIELERDRLASTKRLYDAYNQALRVRADLPGRLHAVAQSLGWGLELRDQPTAHVIATSGGVGSPQTAEGGRRAESVEVPGRCPAVLTVRAVRRPQLDPLLLQYLAGLVGMELERQAAERDDHRDTGAELFAALLDGSATLTAARPELARRGLGERLTVASFAAPDMSAFDHLHHAVALRANSPLLLRKGSLLLALLPHDHELAEAARQALGDGAVAGTSAPLTANLGVPEAVRQARLALAQARDCGPPLLRYTDIGADGGYLPRSVTECRQLVHRFLDPIIEYDRQNGTDLLNTLGTFLGHDGSWKTTAQTLGVHRQTLVYRLRTVEQLTGIKPTSTRGTASFWLALEAGRHAGLLHCPAPPDRGTRQTHTDV